MKVLHIISSLKHGGAEVFLVNLLPLLKSKGIKVEVISLTEGMPLANELERNNIPVYTLKFKGNIYTLIEIAKTRQKLKNLIHKIKPDIIHSHLYMSDFLVRISVKREYHLVSTLHNMDKWWYEKFRIKSRLKTFLDSFLGKLSGTYYIACSEIVKKSAVRALHIPENRIKVIYNGIDLKKFVLKDYSREVSTSSPIIIQVGRFYKEKGHINSINAIYILKKYYPNIKLLLIGDGPLRPFIEEEVKRLDLLYNVEFLGVRNDVNKLLQEADIFWMPSEYEGLPIACLEAMASGLPVVVSAVGGLLEIVENGKTGYFIPVGSHEQLAQKTLYLIKDFDLRKSMGLRGRKVIENKFNIEDTANKYINLYNSLLEG